MSMFNQTNRTIKLTAGLSASLFLATAFAVTLPDSAVAYTYGIYSNDYRICAARLLSAGVPAQSLSQACAQALRPGELASCVASIHRHTELGVLDALSSCKGARRPEELATCVVGISRNTKEPANPAVLNYCNRSLLPLNFAQCVVGLRLEIDVPPAQAMDTCIDASDRISGVLPSFIPGRTSLIQPFPPTSQPNFQPNYPTNPVPGTPTYGK